MRQLRLLISFILLLGVLLTNSQSGLAQQNDAASLAASVSHRKILIGEPFTLTLKGSFSLKTYPGKLPPFPDSIPHFEFLEPVKQDTARTADRITVMYTAKLTSFDSGHWVIPSMGFRVGNKMLRTDSLGIDIATVKLEGNEYRDIHDIVEVNAPPFDWKPWLAGALGLILISLLAWWYIRKRKKPRPEPAAYDSRLSPFDQAMDGLKKLREAGYMQQGDARQHYSVLYDILRVYLVRKFNMPVMSDTTGDILVRLQDGRLGRAQMGQLASVLRIADAVKFARYPSTQEEGIESTSMIEGIIKTLQQKTI